MPEPGLPTCPVASARFTSAWALSVPDVCCVTPMPQSRHEPLNGGRAKVRAARRTSSAGTPVRRSVSSGAYASRLARHSSNPSVRPSMNARSSSCSSSTARAMLLNSATSVPGFGRSHMSV